MQVNIAGMNKPFKTALETYTEAKTCHCFNKNCHVFSFNKKIIFSVGWCFVVICLCVRFCMKSAYVFWDFPVPKSCLLVGLVTQVI